MRNAARDSRDRRFDPTKLLWAVLAAAALAGCGGGGATAGDALVLRFAMEEPEATFDPAVLRTERTVLEWKATYDRLDGERLRRAARGDGSAPHRPDSPMDRRSAGAPDGAASFSIRRPGPAPRARVRSVSRIRDL